MTSPEDKYKNIERIERQLREKEKELQLQKLEAEINDRNVTHKTVKYQLEASEKLWKKKIILGLKLSALITVAIIAVKIASFLAAVMIVGTFIFVTYTLFFTSKN